jgi:hypothetical protein
LKNYKYQLFTYTTLQKITWLLIRGERMRRKPLIILISLLLIALLTSSLTPVLAYFTLDETSKLPKILIEWSRYKAQGNLTEFRRLATEWVAVLKVNAETTKTPPIVRRAANGFTTMTNPPPSTHHYLTWEFSSEDQVNPYFVWDPVIAYVVDGDELDGTLIDNQWADLYAGNFMQNTWGEALTNCYTNDGTITTPGSVWAFAKAGPRTGQENYPAGEWHNYLVAQTAYNPSSMWDWHPIGYAEVWSASGDWYYLGSTINFPTYNRVSISTMCPPNWNPVERSDVLVDLACTVDQPP